MNDPKVIVALDYPDPQQALEFTRKIKPDQCRVKVGKELFTSAGPTLVENLIGQGFDVFLDLKFHDIPNTVRQAVAAAARNVSAAGAGTADSNKAMSRVKRTTNLRNLENGFHPNGSALAAQRICAVAELAESFGALKPKVWRPPLRSAIRHLPTTYVNLCKML